MVVNAGVVKSIATDETSIDSGEPTARAEFVMGCARNAIRRARAASPTCATDWAAMAIEEANETLCEIAKLDGRVCRASMGGNVTECGEILIEAAALSCKREGAL